MSVIVMVALIGWLCSGCAAIAPYVLVPAASQAFRITVDGIQATIPDVGSTCVAPGGVLGVTQRQSFFKRTCVPVFVLPYPYQADQIIEDGAL